MNKVAVMCVCAAFMIGQIRITTAGSAFTEPRPTKRAAKSLVNLFNRVHVPTRYRFLSSVSPASPPSFRHSQVFFFFFFLRLHRAGVMVKKRRERNKGGGGGEEEEEREKERIKFLKK